MLRMFCDSCGREITGPYYQVNLIYRDTEERRQPLRFTTWDMTNKSTAAALEEQEGEKVIPDITGYCPDCAKPAIRLVKWQK